ncbi:excalibur calcium-binding domain-containing protein [Nocardioides sp.]|uniref:excalibur calcium-binding domain-containing protein n=1 Tax=Nocardioides sp. TaxID=35761 RepID=UPI003D0D9709
MNKERTAGLAAGLVLAVTGLTLVAPPAQAAGVWTNCTSVNKHYPHGVGRVNAHDSTSGTPVRNFKKSNRLYKAAMNHNKGLDRDGDKIACEKA